MLPLTILIKRKIDQMGHEISHGDAVWRKLRTFTLVDGVVKAPTRATVLNEALRNIVSDAFRAVAVPAYKRIAQHARERLQRRAEARQQLRRIREPCSHADGQELRVLRGHKRVRHSDEVVVVVAADDLAGDDSMDDDSVGGDVVTDDAVADDAVTDDAVTR